MEVIAELEQPIIRELKAKHDIRHMLAIDRTIMANERTLMSYARTSLTLFVAGVSFLHFTDVLSLHFIGALFIPLGLFTFFFGYYRFLKKKSSIRKEKEVLEQMLHSEYCN